MSLLDISNVAVRAEYGRMTWYVPDLDYATFVARVQKARTRKDKDYFVLRVTVPKDVANRMDIKPGEFVFFKARKAEWYHMLDWSKMGTTWQMLPNEIKNRAILEGLSYPGTEEQMSTIPILEQVLTITRQALGTTNPSGSASSQPMRQVVGIPTDQRQ